MSPAVLIGVRATRERARLLYHTLDFYDVELGWPVTLGHHPGPGPFSLAAAVNRAARAAGDWDVAVIAAGDAVPATALQVEAAAALALSTGKLVFCHDHYYALSQEGTERVLEGWQPNARLAEWDAWPLTFSTISAVPRGLFDAVGGWDERFVGHGFEDFAFWSACWAFAGGFDRVPGPVFHLYHDRPPADYGSHPGYEANKELGARYMAVRTSRAAMLEILREPGAPLAVAG